ncbi:MAG: hypothetical protein KKG33_05455 [candidate division Zixibacteria bacterium]|nr:hypothetical protein [candidate division Zixibacteria bacterium]MBU1470706.1 hypothetical protein [candidate division Zixibacteria bacterium]MBU2624988.1 hypothetical protein [candidate division Zixibacteria bacterium]
MSVRNQNLETIAAVYATFGIHQTGGLDDLADADIGSAVKLTGNFEVGPADDNSTVLGKIVALTLTDADVGKRNATVQIGGVVSLPITTTYPAVGDRVVGGTGGTVKKAPALGGSDPAGGNIARGTVLAVSGTASCTIFLP